MTGHDAIAEDLTAVLAAVGDPRSVTSIARLTGGASRATFLAVTRGPDGESGSLILQREMGEPRRPEGMAAEAAVVRAAGSAGVAVAAVVATHADVGPFESLGQSWLVCEAVEGETLARKLLRGPEYEQARSALVGQLGDALAKIHQADVVDLDFLPMDDELDRYREVADEIGIVSPAFEAGFRWLDRNRPSSGPPTLVHGDFRLGNLIVDEAGLAAVIDWELAHKGDPMEDLGWLCVRAWRFGGEGPVAGIGQREELFASYEQASGRSVDPEAVRWWEVLGTLKWGVMCGLQAERHRSGATRSVELAAIGRRMTEQEYDVLGLIA